MNQENEQFDLRGLVAARKTELQRIWAERAERRQTVTAPDGQTTDAQRVLDEHFGFGVKVQSAIINSIESVLREFPDDGNAMFVLNALAQVCKRFDDEQIAVRDRTFIKAVQDARELDKLL